MTFTVVLRGFALGLSAGVGCLGLCLPIAAPALLGQHRSGFRKSAETLGLFLLGRLSAYIAAGVVSGMLGSAVGTVAASQVAISVAYGLLGVLMVLFGAVQTFPSLGLCRVLKPAAVSGWFPFVFGLLAGISPCPPFLLAVTAAIGAGSITNALLFFSAFYLATTLYLLPLLLSGWATRYGPVRIAARIVAIIIGLYFTAVGAVRLLAPSGRG
ncbi:MAG: sulfite exporter TauE/SafE family protein [candidate division WOR-3 bacterium]